ncbi:hypothetical protein CKO35_03955 [Ectothiorhodospira shaposhnikovii]|uniref:hypothetical protein n=1 Tax=Ectothiorhodospira shaposhnikovii TaxID=1054 RepID=UPI00190409E7|nr:hypothetical protein [Ectothiorhodospira shaposhnikovii]MBK1672462.1 hypothetical protein [Ectothiorhodospira shaposhnikovii]
MPGYIDDILRMEHHIRLTGWAICADGAPVSTLSVQADGRDISGIECQRFPRPDVRQVFPHASQPCGFSILIPLTPLVATCGQLCVRGWDEAEGRAFFLQTEAAPAQVSRERHHISRIQVRRRLRRRGYYGFSTLKEDRAHLCRQARRPGKRYTIKPDYNGDLPATYRRLHETYLGHPDIHGTLYLPGFRERRHGLNILEYVEGEILPWSEDPASPAYGGRLIPPDTCETVIHLSEALNLLEVHTDFYWKNFVFRPDGSVAIIDWEAMEPCTDSNERLAYLYCLMFNHPEWQNTLLGMARSRGIIQEENFRIQLRQKSQRFLDQWADHPTLAETQAGIHRQASDHREFQRLWKKGC